jgi:hypothetical protein
LDLGATDELNALGRIGMLQLAAQGGRLICAGAEEWQRWLSTDGDKRDLENKALQGNTVRRRTGAARQIFATAIRWKLLRDNPFAGFGHSPAVAARFYAQARTEVTDRASQERTGMESYCSVLATMDALILNERR